MLWLFERAGNKNANNKNYFHYQYTNFKNHENEN